MQTQNTYSQLVTAILILIAVIVGKVNANIFDDAFKFLEDLPESFCGDENVNAGTFGIHFRNLNHARLTESLHCEAMSYSSEENFRVELCAKLLDPDYCFASYALLNQLYPERACSLVSDEFWQSVPVENSKIPIKVLSGNEVIELRVDVKCFGELCHRYWRKKLRIRSPTEKLLDETRPGWRNDLRIEVPSTKE